MPKLRARRPNTAINGKHDSSQLSASSTSTSTYESKTSMISVLQSKWEAISDNFESNMEDMTQNIDSKFDEIIDVMNENQDLNNQLMARRRQLVADVIKDTELIGDNIDELLSDAKIRNADLKTDCQAMRDQLKDRKRDKTAAEREVNKVSRRANELRAKADDMNERTGAAQRESKELARVMNLKYKVTATGRVMFELTDRKRNELLVSQDSRDVSHDFWSQINKRYKF